MDHRFFLGVTCGAVCALVAVVACGDDSPQTVDAAEECNCPASEPPLAGRIVRVEARDDISALNAGGNGVGCPAGGVALGGSCSLVQVNDIEQVRLINAGHPVDPEAPNVWSCRWFNGSNAAVTGVASLNCLMPAAQ
jgi:hypothetical protein